MFPEFAGYECLLVRFIGVACCLCFVFVGGVYVVVLLLCCCLELIVLRCFVVVY